MNRLFSNKDLRKLILPLVLEQALAITVGMADTMMISSAGEAAVSGVSIVDMFNMLIFSVLSALSTGGAVVVSQNIGAAKMEEAKKSAKQLLVTVSCFSLLIAFCAVVLRSSLLKLFFGSIDQDVMEAALIYLTISAFSFPFLGIYNSCAALFRSMGKTSVTFRVSIIGNVINVAGNAICIFGLHMGVAGVATITISEGKYHQIKRMFGTIGLGVNSLKRISIGSLSLPCDLAEGECRELTKVEITKIFE